MKSSDANKIPSTFCDLIMKGGITSGVIYPKLISKLSGNYRLKNIGGTSAGAIAAAGAAAAEFRRHTQQTNAGFDELEKLPDLLAENIDIEGSKRSRLLSLFQPTPKLKPHFNVLLTLLNAKLPGLTALKTIFKMTCHFPLLLLLGLAIGMFLLWSTFLGLTGNSLPAFYGALAVLLGWAADTFGIRHAFRNKIKDNHALLRAAIVWLLLGILWTAVIAWFLSVAATPIFVSVLGVCSLTLETLLTGFVTLFAILFFFTQSMARGLTENGFGFCSGLNANDSRGPEALTNWLTGYFNEIAGLDKNARPLTFGDLWRGSRTQETKAPGVKDRVINFEVMTSAISRKMPYQIPFTRDQMEYYFDPEEWGRLFPEAVIKLLEIRGIDTMVYDPESPGRSLCPLPKAESWPIVVAVRMSLSFPLLLSAVPLYARDWTLKSVIKAKRDKKPIPVSKVWFSDGGISSNMPLHFFDSLLPEHPTFAINLTEKHPDAIDENLRTPPEPGFEKWRIFLADGNDQGLNRHWTYPSENGIAGLFDFLKSIIMTMQNWRDEIQFPYPGYRDRIVQISQSPNEGGLNLNMPREVIEALGNAGENAAEHLAKRFVDGDGWLNHRKIRLLNLLAQIDLKLDDLDVKEMEAWQTLLNERAFQKPYKMNEDEKRLADETFKALVEMAAKLQNALPITLAGRHAPHPFAEIRITPRY